MSVPPIASPLSQLGRAPFSFYPPIVGVEHNEWIFRRATWNEIEVINTKTSQELAIPRHFVGEVSLVGEPVVIVDCSHLVQLDTSGLDSLRQLHKAVLFRGGTLHLENLHEQPQGLIERSGFATELRANLPSPEVAAA